MIAGGRTVNLRDLQSLVFMAGASALMVGNYLTTLNQPVEKDLQMLKDLGLDPNWDKHDFSDQQEPPFESKDENATARQKPRRLSRRND
jgi:biotin synthase